MNSLKINNFNNITFKENTLSREMKSQDAILMLTDKNATVRFQQNKDYSHKADSVDSNPIVALGYKLYRTFHIIKDSGAEGSEITAENQLNVLA